MCHCHLLLSSIGGVVLMTTNYESFVVCPLIAMSLSVTWHLPGACSLAGASDVAL